MRDDANFTKIEQETYLVPNITIKELLSTIPYGLELCITPFADAVPFI
jgi:hypothetical protein